MRKIYAIFSAVLLTASLFAQSPQKMSYQAVIRNSSDQLVTNHAVGMQISILQGSPTGTVVYTETQTPTTNANGLVSIEIGGGAGFDAINWAINIFFIKTEIDPTGGTSYTITGTSQLLSVPYALHAKTVASYSETDPIYAVWNKSTGISISASQVSDFQTSVNNNSAVLLNTAKNTYPTADAVKLEAIAGTNTGDETITTIKTKLGITTLSGSNTGDQTISGLGGVVSNTQITGETKTKITYDTKGLVTSGTDATTADIASSTNKNYVTDAQLSVIENTSGTNSGDNATNTLYSGLVANATHTGDVTGSEVLTISNKVTMTGTSPVSITGNPTVIATNPVAISIAEATTSAAGSMSAADKAKLDGIATASYYIGQEKDGGIIYYIYKGSDGIEHGLIVSKTESTGTWSNSDILTGADKTSDGLYNTNLMANDAGTAKNWVESLGPGWYLPSSDELSLLWHNRFHINNSAASGLTKLSAEMPYWSSTERDISTSYYVFFRLGYINYEGKWVGAYYVRAVRAF